MTKITTLTPQLAAAVQQLVRRELRNAQFEIEAASRRLSERAWHYVGIVTEEIEPASEDGGDITAGKGKATIYRLGPNDILQEVYENQVVYQLGDTAIEVEEKIVLHCDPWGDWWVTTDGGGDGGVIEYVIESLSTKASGPYTGLKAASVVIHGTPCGRHNLIGQVVEVIDHSGNLFDLPSMTGYTGWASEMVFLSLADGAECDELTPCHWAAINRVCEPNTGTYAEPCSE